MAEHEETTYIIISVVVMLLVIMVWYHDKYFVKETLAFFFSFLFWLLALFFFFLSGLLTSFENVKSSPLFAIHFSLHSQREQSSLWTSHNKRVILKSSCSARAASVGGKFCYSFSVCAWNGICLDSDWLLSY